MFDYRKSYTFSQNNKKFIPENSKLPKIFEYLSNIITLLYVIEYAKFI